MDRYQEALSSIPVPGCGCHTFLLTVANLGILGGLSAEKIFQDIRQSIPRGNRRIPDREIADAINKALGDHNGGNYTPRTRPQPIIQHSQYVLQKIIERGTITDEDDIWALSPIRLRNHPLGNPALLLKTLFNPHDLIWIGERHDVGLRGNTIRTSSDWIRYFRKGGKTLPHIIINPLNGIPAPKKTGDGTTLRGDGNIAVYRYCMAEFDTLSRGDQIRFWSAVKLPIVALIDSGGKSIHAWLEVARLATVTTSGQWTTEIKDGLYDQILTPLGVDGA